MRSPSLSISPRRSAARAGWLFAFLGAALVVLGYACLPTRTDWSRCTPSDTACLAGYVCDPATWRCVSAQDGGVDAIDGASQEVGAADTVPSGCPHTPCSDPSKPVCEPTSGRCVGCLVSATDCSSPTGVCDGTTNTCVGCLLPSDCPASAPVCLASAKTCVGCASDGDCKGDKPICDTTAHQCVPCGSDAQCTAKDATAGACAPGGACVGCVDSKRHCSKPQAPICDATSATCRTCRRDSECAGAYGVDPGLCVAGSCVTSDGVLYVHNGSTCTGSTVGDGSLEAPFCTPADAVAHLTPSRRVLLLRGPEPLRSFSVSAAGGSPVIVAGQQNASVSVLSGADAAYVTVTGGDVTLRDLTLGGSNVGQGVNVAGGVLRMNRCQVLDNPEGGLTVKNAGFEIVSSLFAGNGKSGANAVVLGAAPANAPTVFAFDTVVDNAGIGVFCAQPYPMTSVISSGNALAFGKDCVATDVCATTCSASPMLATARPYPLTEASVACLDVAGSDLLPTDDLLGQPRPFGRAGDCGALEYRPVVTPDAGTDASSDAPASSSTDAASTPDATL